MVSPGKRAKKVSVEKRKFIRSIRSTDVFFFVLATTIIGYPASRLASCMCVRVHV